MANIYDELYRFSKPEDRPEFTKQEPGVTATMTAAPVVGATVMLPILTVATPSPQITLPAIDVNITPTPSADASGPASDFTSIFKSPMVLAGGVVILGIGALLILRKKGGKALNGFSSRRKKWKSRR